MDYFKGLSTSGIFGTKAEKDKNRQRRHQFYYERLKREKLSYEKFKQAVKALPINIEMLTKENYNESIYQIKRANAA